MLRLCRPPNPKPDASAMTQPKYKGKYRSESLRLPSHDYSANGGYFVTICTHEKQHWFGDVINGEMHLSDIGKIAQQYWADIPKHCDFVDLDAYVVMPNHIHGIIVIDRPPTDNCDRDNPGRDVTGYVPTNASPISEFMSDISPNAGSLGAIVRSHKSAVTRWCRQNRRDDFKWQPRFYESIIRNDGSIDRIRQYIINNPSKWTRDRFHAANINI